MFPQVLKCDVAGLPVEWIQWQEAATLYARGKVRWEAGQEFFVLTGGRQADGEASRLRVNSIIAVADRSGKFTRTPPLTNRTLFQRDGYICLYCGDRFRPSEGSRDHVIPQSRGGADSWTNLASACRDCNRRKDDRTPEEASMPLLATPYVPDYAAYLLLIASGRKILADQQAWLEALASAKRPQKAH